MPRRSAIRTQSTRHVSTQLLNAERNQGGYGLIGSLISLLFGIILTVVALRLLFRLLGANGDNGIVSWIYQASQPLVAPFFGIFGHDVNVMTGRFELDTLVALIVYGIIASLVSRLLSGSRRTHAV